MRTLGGVGVQGSSQMADDPAWPMDSWMPTGFNTMASRSRLQDLLTHTLRTFDVNNPSLICVKCC